MWKKIISALILLILGAGITLFVYKTEPKLNKNFETQKSFFKKFPFRLGLDLSGGSHLIYKADVSGVPSGEVGSSMDALRDVIERRVNLFGVSEPVVQIQHGGFVSGGQEQLIVDLPGITDVKRAVEMIGQTPLLEFKTEAPKDSKPKEIQAVVDKNGNVTIPPIDVNSAYVSTELTGRYLKRATLEFNQNTREPIVSLQFNDEGAKLFAKITKENVGKTVAIYLDGAPVSTPRVNEEIPNGQAVISGNFTPNEAKLLVGRLNSGRYYLAIQTLRQFD
jgi:protein-export membrane protein SecD